MEVSAELSAACDQFEKHIVDHAAKRIEACARSAYDELIEHLECVPNDKLDGIKEIIRRNVLDAAVEVNTFNSIQERAFGISGQSAPSITTQKAINQTRIALNDWGKVST